MKLVRDKIPSIILNSGRKCSSRRVYGADEHMVMLKKKMEEESLEFLQNPSIEEAADMYEVLLTMIELSGHHLDDVIREALYKRDERGGFTDGIILEKVDETG